MSDATNERLQLDESALEAAKRSIEKGAVTPSYGPWREDIIKLLNDAHGHAAGDEALQGLTMAWQGALRTTDAIGRLLREENVYGYEFEGIRHDAGSHFALLERCGEPTVGE